jgi:hypothetical protein
MKNFIFIFSLLCTSTLVQGQQQQSSSSTPAQRQNQWDPRSTEWYFPVPPKVTPGQGTKPPSDAIILFDGKDLSKWESESRDSQKAPAEWKVQNGELIIVPEKGNIQTKEYFGDCQLHIEFKLPLSSKEYGNSGVFLQSRYEIQIIDADYHTYVNGMNGSIYKQQAPLANPYTKNGEWQIYDIYWKAPVFNGNDELLSPAMITVVLNGIVIQNNYALTGHTPYTGLPRYTAHGRLPLLLQNHGAEVAFRNIWIRHL